MKTGTVQLGDVCEFVRGITFPSGEGKPVPFDNSIACLTTSGVQEDVAWSSRRFVQRTRVGNAKQMLQAGDILISTANSKELVGKSCLVHRPPFPCTFGAFVTVARPQESLYPPYLAYWMTTRKYLAWCFKQSSNTTNISNLRVSELEELVFPLPDLSEQRRIAGRLEQMDRLRRTRRYTLELTDTFLPAAFLELFGNPISNSRGWPAEILDDCCERFIDYRGRTPEYSSEGIPHVTAACIKEHEIQWAFAKRVTEETYEAYMTRGLPTLGDVLLTTEAPLGETTVIKTNRQFSMAQRLLLIRPGPNLLPDYLCHLLGHVSFRPQLLRFATGSTVKGISSESFRAIPIPLPKLSIQQKFTALVERVERLRALQREALRQAEHLFASLLYRVFSD